MTFPILYRGGHAKVARRDNPQWPSSVPWQLVDECRRHIEQWYGTPLEVLARHGLPPGDLLAAINDADPNGHVDQPLDAVVDALVAAVAAWEARRVAAVEPEPEVDGDQ